MRGTQTPPVLLSAARLAVEIERIVQFLQIRVGGTKNCALGISGGVDSDVTARLAVQALGSRRVSALLMLQDDQDPSHVRSARELAEELGLRLVEIDCVGIASDLVRRLEKATSGEPSFRSADRLDTGKAKNSVRTAVLSMFAERDQVVLGTGNRTEIMTGFYLPFGDGLGHLVPLAHLFKSEVYGLARQLGTHSAVLERPASAGYWVGESDLYDLAHWLFYERPLLMSCTPTREQQDTIDQIHRELSFEMLDVALATLEENASAETGPAAPSLSLATLSRVRSLVENAALTKGRRLHECLTRLGP